MEGVIGVVTCFAADFAPKYWANCDGQTLPIAQNQALFSILGTTYGGNGVNTFQLPDLRGRTPVCAGQGQGLSNYALGQQSGTETTTMTMNNLPPHAHNGAVNVKLEADSNGGAQPSPEFAYPAALAGAYATTATPGVSMVSPNYTVTVGVAGASQPIPIRPPYLAVNYIICLMGIFPSRN